MSERQILPDCMMPDGAEPCKGHLQLQEQVRSLQAEVDRLREIAECNDPGAVGLRAGESHNARVCGLGD